MRFALRQRKILINASAVGYYGSCMDDEIGRRLFSRRRIHVRGLHSLEDEAKKGCPLGARVVLLRFGIVLGRDGGALP